MIHVELDPQLVDLILKCLMGYCIGTLVGGVVFCGVLLFFRFRDRRER